MIAVDQRHQPDDRQHRAHRVERGCRRVLRLRDRKKPERSQRDDHERDVDEEHRAPPEVLEQQAAEHRAEDDPRGRRRPPRRRLPAPAPGRVKTLVMMESVAGMISAPPTPMTARAAISVFADVGEGRRHRAGPKMTRPTVSASLRP